MWVWAGEGRVPEVPGFSRPPAGHLIHAEIEVPRPLLSVGRPPPLQTVPSLPCSAGAA